jgi:hypothetical protein
MTDWARGTRSEANANWYYEERNSEEKRVVETVKSKGGESPEPRSEGPKGNSAGLESADYLFVWGYRPEIYYWSKLVPASRFLSTQPLTGVPADVHFFGDDYRLIASGETTAAARAELLSDLEVTRPKYIVDELGFYNAHLSIQSYPELQRFMEGYKPLGTTGRFFVYLRKEFSKRHRKPRGATQ